MREFCTKWWKRIATVDMLFIGVLTLLASLFASWLKQFPGFSLFGALIIALLIGMIIQFPIRSAYVGSNDGRKAGVKDAAGLISNKLLRIGIKASDKPVAELAPANLVFLVDVSGSMSSPDKLALVQQTLRLLTAQLRPEDLVSIVTYASGTEVVLQAALGSDKKSILAAIDKLKAGGSTADAVKQGNNHHNTTVPRL